MYILQSAISHIDSIGQDQGSIDMSTIPNSDFDSLLTPDQLKRKYQLQNKIIEGTDFTESDYEELFALSDPQIIQHNPLTQLQSDRQEQNEKLLTLIQKLEDLKVIFARIDESNPDFDIDTILLPNGLTRKKLTMGISYHTVDVDISIIQKQLLTVLSEQILHVTQPQFLKARSNIIELCTQIAEYSLPAEFRLVDIASWVGISIDNPFSNRIQIFTHSGLIDLTCELIQQREPFTNFETLSNKVIDFLKQDIESSVRRYVKKDYVALTEELSSHILKKLGEKARHYRENIELIIQTYPELTHTNLQKTLDELDRYTKGDKFPTRERRAYHEIRNLCYQYQQRGGNTKEMTFEELVNLFISEA